MQLNIPTQKQEKESMHCGIACLKMVIDYYGKELNYNNLINDFKIYEEGVYTADLGKKALDLGFRVRFMHHNTKLLDKSVTNITEKNIDKLRPFLKKERSEKQRLEISKEIEFIGKGGKFSSSIPKLSIVDSAIKKKIPIILTVENKSFREYPNKKSNHFIIIIGKEKNNYILRDPSPDYKDTYQVSRDKLLLSWYLSGAYTLIISP